MERKFILIITLLIASRLLIHVNNNALGRQLPAVMINNSWETNQKYFTQIISLYDYGYVVVWQLNSYTDIRFQVFDINGNKVGSVTSVRNYEFCYYYPSVTATTNGDFFVVFADRNRHCSFSYYPNFYLRIYKYNYQASYIHNVEFPLSQYLIQTSTTTLTTGEIAIAATDGNNWIEYYIYNPNLSIKFGVRYLNTNWKSKYSISIAALQNGRFIIVYGEFTSSDCDIYGSIIDNFGVVKYDYYRVNTAIIYNQFNPSVAGLSNGNFVVAYDSNSPTGYRVLAKIFSSEFQTIIDEFLVNSFNYPDYHLPSVSQLKDGGFIIVYANYLSTTSWDIYAKKFDSLSVSKSPEYIATTVVANEQRFPSVTQTKNEDYIIAYISDAWSRIYIDKASEIETPSCQSFSLRITRDYYHY